jgi:hypothetical protein
MKTHRLLLIGMLLVLATTGTLPIPLLAQLPAPSTNLQRRSSSSGSKLLDEPGTITVEGLLPRPVIVKVAQESTIYYNADLQRPLGAMAAGTVVTLVALGDSAYRVRGRARHGDVAGWLRPADVISPDPDLHANLKKVHARALQVRDLIANREVALGMTADEVRESLGKPTRSTRKVTPQGREETLEYSIFDRVPQTVLGRDPLGNIIQSIVYVKVETGTLSITFKDDLVNAIEEKKGSPLGGGGVKIVVPPIIFR